MCCRCRGECTCGSVPHYSRGSASILRFVSSILHHRKINPQPPLYPRVRLMSVRLQGFPDTFVFRGTIQQQYKQVANAVSPQLAKAIGRCVLATLLAAHGAAEPEKAEFGGGLLNFAVRSLFCVFLFKASVGVSRWCPVPLASIPAACP